MNKRSKLFGALLAASLVSATAFAADSTSTTTSTTSTGTTNTTGSTGTTTTTKPTALNSTDKCSGGGSRTLAGSWDTTTGTIDVTTTLDACILRNGETHNGTTSLKGTLLATKGGDFTVDVVSKIDTTIDRKDGTKLARKCTTAKNGSYVNKTKIFDGSITRTDCSLTGQVREHENVAEYLLRDAISDGEDGGFNRDHRLLPKERDTDTDDDKDDDKKPTTTPPQPATK